MPFTPARSCDPQDPPPLSSVLGSHSWDVHPAQAQKNLHGHGGGGRGVAPGSPLRSRCGSARPAAPAGASRRCSQVLAGLQSPQGPARLHVQGRSVAWLAAGAGCWLGHQGCDAEDLGVASNTVFATQGDFASPGSLWLLQLGVPLASG